MNGQSKREKIDSFIKEQVRDAVAELAMHRPGDTERLRDLREPLAIYIASRIASTYRMQELADIMAWKKPKEIK